MKKLIVILMVLAVSSTAYGWMIEGHWEQLECKICGKTIYEHREPDCGIFSMPTYSRYGTSYLYPEREIANSIVFNSIKVCDRCYKKYNKYFQDIIKEGLLLKIKDNLRQKKLHEIERHFRKKRQIESEVNKLQKKLKEHLKLWEKEHNPIPTAPKE